MRVAIVVPSLAPRYGGPSAKARHLSHALREARIEVEVIGCGHSAGCTGLPILGRFHSNDIPARVAPLRRAVRRAEIVHVLGFREPVSALSESLAVVARKPLVVEPVGTHRRRLRTYRLKTLFDRTAGAVFLRRASIVIATSKAEMTDLEADGVPAEKIRLRPNGIVVESLDPLPDPVASRVGLGLQPDDRVIVSLGRIIGLKGLSQIPKVLAGLPQDVVAYIGGPDEGDGSVEAIRTETRRAGVEGRLILHPHEIWGDEKRTVLAAASVFCQPSESESFGSAAAEAAALGIPVVCSTTSGIAEWLEPTSSATFSYGDISQLTTALNRMLSPHARIAAEKKRSIITERLSWRAVAVRQIELYEEVLAAKDR